MKLVEKRNYKKHKELDRNVQMKKGKISGEIREKYRKIDRKSEKI